VTPREAMDQALKDAVATHLRPQGFRGSLPHLRRRSADQICLVSFQYFSSGGSFAVEVADCDGDGFTTSWGAHKPPNKVTALDIPSPRPRLGSPDFPDGDHWFVFGVRAYEPGHDAIGPAEHYDAIAAEVIALVGAQAEPFWREQLHQRMQS
jgi:hypothetical protein